MNLKHKTTSMSRQELKYLISVAGQKVLCNYLKTYMVEDPAMTDSLGYDVSSLYFDSPEFMCLAQKANGNRRKQKFRLRIYENRSSPFFLEVKSKTGSVSSKSRHAVVAAGAPWLAGLEELARFFNAQGASPEAGDFLYNYHRFQLQPVLWVHFRRKAYVCPQGSGLRLTIDQSLRSQFFSAHGKDFTQKSVTFGGAADILELKFTQQIPAWLDLLMAEMQLEKIGFSKYYEGYSALQASAFTRNEHLKPKGTFL
jgi:hypothetical protein